MGHIRIVLTQVIVYILLLDVRRPTFLQSHHMSNHETMQNGISWIDDILKNYQSDGSGPDLDNTFVLLLGCTQFAL